jgi:SEC-C motif
MRASRNDPCPCGSGKKYKRCHLPEDQAAAVQDRASGRIVQRNGSKMMVHGNVSDDTLAMARDYFAERDRHGGPARQMVDFVAPFLEEAAGDLEAMNRVMTFGMVFWNIALLPDHEREGATKRAEDAASKNDEDREAFRSMASMMVARHQTMFPWMHERRA